MTDFLGRFARNKGAVIGAVVLAAIALLALLAPVLFPGSPWDIDGRPFQRPFESLAAPHPGLSGPAMQAQFQDRNAARDGVNKLRHPKMAP